MASKSCGSLLLTGPTQIGEKVGGQSLSQLSFSCGAGTDGTAGSIGSIIIGSDDSSLELGLELVPGAAGAGGATGPDAFDSSDDSSDVASFELEFGSTPGMLGIVGFDGKGCIGGIGLTGSNG